jgi:uncharacterized protein (DUF302 family)
MEGKINTLLYKKNSDATSTEINIENLFEGFADLFDRIDDIVEKLHATDNEEESRELFEEFV